MAAIPAYNGKDEHDLYDAVREAVDHCLTERAPSDEEVTKSKRRKIAVSGAKFVGVITSVAMSAYMGLQQAVTKLEQTTAEVSAIAEKNESGLKDVLTRVRANERDVTKLEGKIDSLDKKVSDGFADIKEELRYLRRR